MANPRVHEIAAELQIETKAVLAELEVMGQIVRGPSSSIAPPVARKVKERLIASGVQPAPRIPAAELASLQQRAAELLAGLPRALPELVVVLRGMAGGRWGSALERGSADGNLYFVPDGARSRVFAEGSRLSSGRDLVELPSLAGVALLGGKRVVAWYPFEDRVNVAAAAFASNGDAPRRVGVRQHAFEITEASEGYVRPLRESPAGPVAMLAGLSSVIPVVESDGTGAARNAQRSGGVAARNDDAVEIVHLTRRSRGEGERQGSRVPTIRASQWKVRGHYRNQWYPSLGEHRRLWIADHTAGPSDAPMRERQRVYVIRPTVES